MGRGKPVPKRDSWKEGFKNPLDAYDTVFHWVGRFLNHGVFLTQDMHAPNDAAHG